MMTFAIRISDFCYIETNAEYNSNALTKISIWLVLSIKMDLASDAKKIFFLFILFVREKNVFFELIWIVDIK